MEQSTVNELESLDNDLSDLKSLFIEAADMLQSTLEDSVDQLEDPQDAFAEPVVKLDALIKRLEAGEKLVSLDDLLQHARGIRQSAGMKQ